MKLVVKCMRCSDQLGRWNGFGVARLRLVKENRGGKTR